MQTLLHSTAALPLTPLYSGRLLYLEGTSSDGFCSARMSLSIEEYGIERGGVGISSAYEVGLSLGKVMPPSSSPASDTALRCQRWWLSSATAKDSELGVLPCGASPLSETEAAC